MKWFGPAQGRHYEADTPHVDAPIGELCVWCDTPIGPDDAGVLLPGSGVERPYHIECHLRGVVGGVNHQLRRCLCCGGTEPPDPPWLPRREAARQAVKLWERILDDPP